MFDQWYGKLVLQLYKVQYLLTENKELKDVTIEFGFRETNTQTWQEMKDFMEKPVNIINSDNKQRGKAICYHHDVTH